MDRQTRKELKSDKFAEEVFDVFEWSAEHKTEVIRYGGIVLALAVVGLIWLFYSRHQAGVRQDDLAKALRVDDATFGATDAGGSSPFSARVAASVSSDREPEVMGTNQA